MAQAEERFKGCLLGYTYRQKVVQQVRQQYEEIVSELQPLADESVEWPSKVGLCYPQFKPNKIQDDQDAPPISSPIVTGSGACTEPLTPSSEGLVRDKPKGTTSFTPDDVCEKLKGTDEDTARDELEGTTGLTPDEGTARDELKKDGTARDELKDITGLTLFKSGEIDSDVFQTLHNDEESLLELRNRLGMELVWLKQAITSRQKYIQLKKKLEIPSQK